MRKNTKGFTLLEIIIVIVISGIVFVPMSFAVNSYYSSQNIAQSSVEIGKVQAALETFVRLYKHIPNRTSSSDLTAWQQIYVPAKNITLNGIVPQGMNLNIIQEYVPSSTTTDALPAIVQISGATCQKYTAISTDTCIWNIWGL
jgi:prepilin-type N-terminal cleavage/methylation domain-containing protein